MTFLQSEQIWHNACKNCLGEWHSSIDHIKFRQITFAFNKKRKNEPVIFGLKPKIIIDLGLKNEAYAKTFKFDLFVQNLYLKKIM